MDTAQIPRATLAEFYRFALLLCGEPDAAETALAGALAECGPQLDQLRSATSRHACLAARVRAHCANGASGGGAVEEAVGAQSEPTAVARHFQRLPEPERSALALFHLDLFTCQEIADVLRIAQAALPDVIGRARARLEESLRAPQTAA